MHIQLAACFLLLASVAAQNQQVTLEPAKDNTLYFDPTGSLSNGAGSRMFCGDSGLMTGGQLRRALVAWNVAAAVPKHATVVSVSLTMSVAMASSPAQAVDLHRVLADWGEGTSIALSGQGGGAPATNGDATWVHTFFPSKTWQTPGGDFSASPSATTMVTSIGSYTWSSTPQMVADVQGWLDKPAANFGWMARTLEAGTNTAKAFETRESLTPANRPLLTIVYTPPAAAVFSTGNGCTGGGPTPLAIAASGLPKVPNAAFALTINGGPTSGPRAMLIALDLAAVPIPFVGCFIYVNPATLAVTLPASPPSFPLPVPNNPTLIGAELSFQGAAVDPSTLGIATSNALTLRFGL